MSGPMAMVRVDAALLGVSARLRTNVSSTRNGRSLGIG